MRAALLVRDPASETSLGDLDHVFERDGVNDDPAGRVDDRDPRLVGIERDAIDVAALDGRGEDDISWALAERILSAQIPDNDMEQLAEAFELLSGRASPRSDQLVSGQAASSSARIASRLSGPSLA